MVRYFTSRMISEKLGINLAKWKRWSREFLPPDPLGGKQSGYARHYSVEEAVTVYLGGLLVGRLNLSVPESKALLIPFVEWMTQNNLMPVQNHQSADAANGRHMEEKPVKLILQSNAEGKNRYIIQQVLQSKNMAKSDASLSDPVPHPSETSVYREETISEIEIFPAPSDQTVDNRIVGPISEKTLHVSTAIQHFLKCLGAL